jgi:glycerophosphoryl diester phosphodiesterase
MIIAILLGICILYVAMINPGKKRNHPALSVKYYAHRGFHFIDGIPENSMTAFRKARDLGYGIELDIQMTKDHVIVVHHDYDLKRTCGVNHFIRDLEYEELCKYRLKGSDETIPKFCDVLREIDGRVPLLIELKMEDFNTELCRKAAKLLDAYPGVYCIESFHPYALYWFRKHRPQVIRGQLSEQFFKEKEWKNAPAYFVMKNLLTNFITKPDFIAYHYKYQNCLPLRICRKFYDIPIYGWTFRSKTEYEKHKESFYGFIFEKFMVS